MGIQQMLLAGSPVLVAGSITFPSTPTLVGYINGGQGSIAFTFGSTINGLTITGIASNGGVDDLQVGLSGSPAQNAFNSITVQDSAGTLRTYLSAAATFAGGLWQWGTGSNMVWQPSFPQTRTFSFS